AWDYIGEFGIFGKHFIIAPVAGHQSVHKFQARSFFECNQARYQLRVQRETERLQIKVIAGTVFKYTAFQFVYICADGEGRDINKPDAAGVIIHGRIITYSTCHRSSHKAGSGTELLRPVIVLGKSNDIKKQEKKEKKLLFHGKN